MFKKKTPKKHKYPTSSRIPNSISLSHTYLHSPDFQLTSIYIHTAQNLSWPLHQSPFSSSIPVEKSHRLQDLPQTALSSSSSLQQSSSVCLPCITDPRSQTIPPALAHLQIGRFLNYQSKSQLLYQDRQLSFYLRSQTGRVVYATQNLWPGCLRRKPIGHTLIEQCLLQEDSTNRIASRTNKRRGCGTEHRCKNCNSTLFSLQAAASHHESNQQQ